MGNFSAVAAATEGLRIIRERPVAVVLWAVVYVAAFLAGIAIVAAVVGVGAIGSIFAAAENPTRDTQALVSVLSGLAGALLLVIPLAIIVGAVLMTAPNRAVLRPQDSSAGYLRLSMDEVRVFGVRFVLSLLIMLLMLVIILVCALLSRVHWSLALLGGIAGFCAFVYVAVRLSLAVPQSFATRAFNLFGSWALSKGHFWPMLGAYLLAGVIYFAIAFVVGIVFAIIGLVTMGSAGAIAGRLESAAGVAGLLAAFGVVGVIRGLVQALVSAAGLAIMGGAPAAIYRDLAGVGQAEAF